MEDFDGEAKLLSGFWVMQTTAKKFEYRILNRVANQIQHSKLDIQYSVFKKVNSNNLGLRLELMIESN